MQTKELTMSDTCNLLEVKCTLPHKLHLKPNVITISTLSDNPNKSNLTKLTKFYWKLPDLPVVDRVKCKD